MSILVAGGAGYIGSHAVYTLIEKHEKVVVVDSLATGQAEAIHPEAVFYQGDIRDRHFLKQVFANEDIEAVMHFAATPISSKSGNVFASFNENITGMETLLAVMKEFGVGRIVFASSASVYGDAIDGPITEETEPRPVHPHGKAKWAMEKMLMEAETAYGLKYVILRSFNAGGALLAEAEDDDSDTHLISSVLRAAIGQKPFVSLSCNGRTAAEGTCIRDYVHVQDLAEAHVLAVSHLRKGGESRTFNLGYEEGYSAEQVIQAAQYVTGISLISTRYAEGSCSAPDTLIASSSRARKELGWIPKHNSLIAIIRDAWNWHSANPNGYGSRQMRQG
ncbi:MULTISPECIES: UDP-glucose 4-epimerase GalE [Bacillus]|uniref:UDP-glucose 4-epimerase n=1 Tax=Bacillus glycinifermentans TaxID=1664069 RepID=A0AAJ3Z3K5_9BACI|nr:MULTISPECIES: UDP-glucose 4-epimerase GalE [Bacillus]KKB73980.1 UDP-glucose 4-epimerase [Bacillus sp. TH008]MBU8786123.1 UDP-glucose 4-epimerase GalE [Bacillus glycinifermentans]MDU0070270.1 UDP-glucose 4-epimerase GalE [Bacillus sp. IG6]MED8017794.1 UDP-glucose 4-epimerase GalE [Bacillus glycinifermentans]NUJ16717.1 UDP-glucose 4-epimerase GalE [Bacillus glycinifermentans]